MVRPKKARQPWDALQERVAGVTHVDFFEKAHLKLQWKEGTARVTQRLARQIMSDGAQWQAFLAGEGLPRVHTVCADQLCMCTRPRPHTHTLQGRRLTDYLPCGRCPWGEGSMRMAAQAASARTQRLHPKTYVAATTCGAFGSPGSGTGKGNARRQVFASSHELIPRE